MLPLAFALYRRRFLSSASHFSILSQLSHVIGHIKEKITRRKLDDGHVASENCVEAACRGFDRIDAVQGARIEGQSSTSIL